LRKSNLKRHIYAKLDEDGTLFQSVSRKQRNRLLKQFASVLTEVMEAHEAQPLSYDVLIAITAKSARRLKDLPNSNWKCSKLDEFTDSRSITKMCDKTKREKNDLLDHHLNQSAKNVKASGHLTCDWLARIYPQAYLPITDM
jgi:hypothetical protein